MRRILATAAYVVNKQDKAGFSALHLAARRRHIEMVRLLLEARADSGLRANVGTALDLARTNGADDALLALLCASNNLDPDASAVASGIAQEEEYTPQGPWWKPQTLDSLTPEQRAALLID